MGWRVYDHIKDDNVLKDICYNCGSASVKGTYPFFRRMMYYSQGNYWCEILDDKAFYFASRARKHVRLIAIAVKQEHQLQKIGEKVLFRLLQRVSLAGLDTLTLRTSMHENGQYFWLKQGARIMDVKGDDYEMEIKIIK